MVKWIENKTIVHRLRAISTKDEDIWATRNMRQNIEHWSRNAFPNGTPEIIPYIPTTELIKRLNEDIRKLEALKKLSHPEEYGYNEIGSDIHATGEMFDRGEASIDTLIDYIKNLIKQLTECTKY